MSLSAQDPTNELNALVDGIEAGRISEEAVAFCDSACDTTDSILATMRAMKAHGVPAPTPDQRRALRNIYVGACKWLAIEPILPAQSPHERDLERKRTISRSSGVIKASRRTREFHRQYCPSAMKLSPREATMFDNAALARSAGFRPCLDCCRGL